MDADKKNKDSDLPVISIGELSQIDPNKIEFVAPTVRQAKYGSLGQQALAGIEAFGRGATLGATDYIARKLSSPEAVEGRKEENPLTAFGFNALGGAGTIAATGGIAAPLEEAALGASALKAGSAAESAALLGGNISASAAKELGSKAAIQAAGTVRSSAARALGFGAEGAAMGLGNVVSNHALGEYDLGDPSLNAQKILAEIGMGAAVGGGLGLLSKSIGALPAMLRKTGAAQEAAAATESAAIPVGTQAQSLQELAQQTENVSRLSGNEGLLELPQKEAAAAAAARLQSEMPIPITQIQLDSLNSQDARNAFKVMAEVPGNEGQTLRNAFVAQKKSLNQLLDREIDSIAPNYTPTADAAEAGHRVSEVLSKQIEGIREELKPALKALKKTDVNEVDHLPGVVDYLTNPDVSKFANPKMADIFDAAAENIRLKPYNTSMGVEKSTYQAIKEAIKGIESNPYDFEKLFNVRDNLTQHIDPQAAGKAASQITSAKAAMMDYIQDSIQRVNPEAQVRDIFKRYAVNEQNAEFIEQVIGAKIGDNWRSLAHGKPDEAILKKIFANSEATQALKKIMSPEDFQKVLADHLKVIKSEVTDQGAFSANKFMSKLRKNGYALDEAFAGNEQPYNKINDVITTMRAFTDDAPNNPSGTAKTLLGAIQQGISNPTSIPGEALGLIKQGIKNAKLRSEINTQLAGEQGKLAKLNTVQGMLNRTDQQIRTQAKSIFSSERIKNVAREITLSASDHLSDDQYKKHVETLQRFTQNPQALMDHMASSTEHLYEAAPEMTQGIHNSVMNAVQYLSSKIPKDPTHLALSPNWQPNRAQKLKFNQYFNAVNKPTDALKQIANGTLTNETMEALTVVHPQLLQAMREEVLSHMKLEKAKMLPYSPKMALSKFFGQPLDANLLPQAIQANQAAFNLQLSQQSAPKEGRKTNAGSAAKIKLSTRTATMSDRSQDEE